MKRWIREHLSQNDKEVEAYNRGRNNERERVAIAQAKLRYGKFVCSIAEAETAMYLKVARQALEAGEHRLAQGIFEDIANCGQRYAKLLTLNDMSNWKPN